MCIDDIPIYGKEFFSHFFCDGRDVTIVLSEFETIDNRERCGRSRPTVKYMYPCKYLYTSVDFIFIENRLHTVIARMRFSSSFCFISFHFFISTFQFPVGVGRMLLMFFRCLWGHVRMVPDSPDYILVDFSFSKLSEFRSLHDELPKN